jgi:hypothetical protein
MYRTQGSRGNVGNSRFAQGKGERYGCLGTIAAGEEIPCSELVGTGEGWDVVSAGPGVGTTAAISQGNKGVGTVRTVIGGIGDK